MDGSFTVIKGNVVRDPELKQISTGDYLASFTVAINRGPRDNKKTTFVDVVAWRSLAENLANTFKSGLRVWVEGYLEQNTWEDKEGNTRSKISLQARDGGPSVLYGYFNDLDYVKNFTPYNAGESNNYDAGNDSDSSDSDDDSPF